MYKLILVHIFSLSMSLALNAQDSKVVDLIDKDTERSFYIKKQLDLYNNLPSTLSLWNYSDWSTIEFKLNQQDGDFKTFDNFKINQQFGFRTRSILSFPNKGLKFYGHFTHRNTTNKKADWNMFFKKSGIGSPFRFITDRMGDWRTKHYGLKGFLSKKLGHKINLGIGVQYDGDLYFRVLDTRNDQYNLSINAISSITYEFKENNNLTVGLKYIRKKSEISIRNEYPSQAAYSPEFDVFSLDGMYQFIEYTDFSSIYVIDQSPSLILGYNSGTKNIFNTIYEFYPGKEEWERKLSNANSAEGNKMYKYEYNQHKIKSSYLINNPLYNFLAKLDGKLISGKGYENRLGYNLTYEYNEQNVQIDFDLLRKNRNAFNNSSLSFNFNNIAKQDMRSAHLIEYTNLFTNINTDFNLIINTDNKLKLLIGGGYKINLDHTHNYSESANHTADDDQNYTKNISHNEMAYYTADYYSLDGQITWFKKLKKTSIELVLSYKNITPTDIKINNNLSFLEKSSQRNNIGLSLNLVF